ncbi:hypothetical protein M409DRAFT_30783 [Zasmidium cellare ATCC 36951]|uniref:Ubiquitin-like domain-containing protein n=1 Tax=Zasmidium cellare ATCC 36951 TaxID=1080233 RepID=A0A6A6BVA3_ZASCE|nr:uncharacterized protein M409DRAFT_30783 [Zasmidium cellare ATCC 36951]KAF2158691.1 hypothetical protein M409DRAFT_30783 [Zasmidium cellare ATCC 36951]
MSASAPSSLPPSNGSPAVKADMPFQLEIKFDTVTSKTEPKQFVQLRALSTVRELAFAIDCELDVEAHRIRLVTMGKTLYNHGAINGHVNEDRTLCSLDIMVNHVIWVKPCDSDLKVEVL